MSNLRNKVQLIGNLGADPEIVNLESGKKLAKFSMATTETWRTKDGEKKQDTQWHNCIAWNNVAEILEKYVNKGSEIAINGKLVTRNYEDTEGKKRYITEIVVNEILLLGNKKEGVVNADTPETAPIGEGLEPDDLPF